MSDPTEPQDGLEVRDGAEITGGTRPLRQITPEEMLFCEEIYAGWRLAGVTEVTCSRATFEAHLDYELIWAGPWKWNIVSMAYGEVKMYGAGGRYLGTCNVTSNIIIPKH